MNQVHKFDLIRQVDLEIEGLLIPQVIIDFGSQVNIFPKSTWLKLGQPHLTKFDFYIKLIDQGLVEPLGIWKDVKATIMVILNRINFEVI